MLIDLQRFFYHYVYGKQEKRGQNKRNPVCEIVLILILMSFRSKARNLDYMLVILRFLTYVRNDRSGKDKNKYWLFSIKIAKCSSTKLKCINL
ncbi:MAG: hypothetical protein A2031_04440 [Deltaproteobacteria bacterium RBG_19FT_COMBO_43_11]|nr:MAG: hypothetical protein A2031_04440 [Deltaproteobacteria bacterium RBG_19FT_COMBO_43_11]